MLKDDPELDTLPQWGNRAEEWKADGGGRRLVSDPSDIKLAFAAYSKGVLSPPPRPVQDEISEIDDLNVTDFASCGEAYDFFSAISVAHVGDSSMRDLLRMHVFYELLGQNEDLLGIRRPKPNLKIVFRIVRGSMPI